MTPLFSSEDCNCFALRQAARFVTQLYERHLDPIGITPAQFSILIKLARRPNLTMVELSESMVMDRTTLVRALKPLQRLGLLKTDAAEHDSRARIFSLSEQGEQTLEQAVVAWRVAQKEFESKFGESRAKALRGELFSMTAD
jgi:DNA-binding MarR family transcriptional regulator